MLKVVQGAYTSANFYRFSALHLRDMSAYCLTVSESKSEYFFVFMYEQESELKQLLNVKQLLTDTTVSSQWALAYCYMHGIGIETNCRKAFGILQQVAKQCTLAYYHMAMFLNTGYNEDTRQLACKIFKRSADAGCMFSMLKFGSIQLQQNNVTIAFDYLKKSADAGNIQAYEELGHLYWKGEHVEKDLHMANAVLLKGALQGNSNCQYNLYQVCRKLKDNTNSIYWLQIAAQNDSANAQYDLAIEHFWDNSRTKQYGIALLKKAANKNFALAELDLAFCYRDGDGVPSNCDEFLFWLHRAADHGSDSAMYELGKMYRSGHENLTQDDVQALRWFKSAAKLGNSSAISMVQLQYGSSQVCKVLLNTREIWIGSIQPLSQIFNKNVVVKSKSGKYEPVSLLSYADIPETCCYAFVHHATYFEKSQTAKWKDCMFLYY